MWRTSSFLAGEVKDSLHKIKFPIDVCQVPWAPNRDTMQKSKSRLSVCSL